MSRCSNMGGEFKQKESLFRKILGRIKSDFLLVKAPLLVLVVFCILSQLIFHTMCPFVIVFGRPKLFGIFGRNDDVIIPWDDIELIGEDTILVASDVKYQQKRKKGSIQTANFVI